MLARICRFKLLGFFSANKKRRAGPTGLEPLQTPQHTQIIAIILKGLRNGKSVTLKDVQDEVRELRMLYKQMLDRLISTEEPIREEKRAIAERGEIAEERELMKALGVHRRN